MEGRRASPHPSSSLPAHVSSHHCLRGQSGSRSRTDHRAPSICFKSPTASFHTHWSQHPIPSNVLELIGQHSHVAPQPRGQRDPLHTHFEKQPQENMAELYTPRQARLEANLSSRATCCFWVYLPRRYSVSTHQATGDQDGLLPRRREDE